MTDEVSLNFLSPVTAAERSPKNNTKYSVFLCCFSGFLLDLRVF